MKIERISENQIKCTLNRSDLASRQIKLSELAYGTEKTKSLFQDMMEQASNEFGFDANDNPLMIEAIPVSMDCLVLMITKVDDPDELDTKFASFANLEDVSSGEDESERDIESHDSHFRTPEEAEEAIIESLVAAFTPNGKERKPSKKNNSINVMQQIFSFDSLDRVIEFAHHVENSYKGENSLYKCAKTGRFYLIMEKSEHSEREFAAVCATALEYGSKELSGFARGAYMSEHYELFVLGNAIQSLANV